MLSLKLDFTLPCLMQGSPKTLKALEACAVRNCVAPCRGTQMSKTNLQTSVCKGFPMRSTEVRDQASMHRHDSPLDTLGRPLASSRLAGTCRPETADTTV